MAAPQKCFATSHGLQGQRPGQAADMAHGEDRQLLWEPGRGGPACLQQAYQPARHAAPCRRALVCGVWDTMAVLLWEQAVQEHGIPQFGQPVEGRLIGRQQLHTYTRAGQRACGAVEPGQGSGASAAAGVLLERQGWAPDSRQAHSSGGSWRGTMVWLSTPLWLSHQQKLESISSWASGYWGSLRASRVAQKDWCWWCSLGGAGVLS